MIFTSEFASTAIFVIAILFIGTITAVVLMVTFPSAEDTSAIGAPELGRFASVSGAVIRILVRIITAIVVTIAQPIRFNANGSRSTFQMIIRASDVTILAGIFRFVRRGVIFAIIDAVAYLTIGYAPMIFASEFSSTAILVITILLIGSIPAVVLMVTLPSAEDAPAIGTPELRRFASVSGAIIFVFIRIVATIVVTVASPKSGYAFSVSANKFVVGRTQSTATLYGRSVDALFSVVDGSESARTFTNGSRTTLIIRRSRMARTRGCGGAPSVIDFAHVGSALLTIWRENLNTSRRIIQAFDNFNQVRSGVFICSVNST
jgi:hypothetical protein